MQFTTTLLAAVLASVAIAHPGYTVPEGAPDGVYAVSIDESGNEVHEAVSGGFSAKFAARSAAPASRLEARGSVSVGCNSNMPLNHADTDAANSALDAQCGGYTTVGANKDFYSISNNVVAYYCNTQDWTEGCRAVDRQSASQAITAKCGLYNAGWQHTETDFSGDDPDFYYGYADKSNTFCGRGESYN